MTREEAIEMLKRDKEQRGKCFISDALDMAIKALEQETVSKESYDHEYFLRKEFEMKIARLEQQEPILDKIRAKIKELDNKVCQQFLIEDVDKEVHHAYQDCLNILDKYKAETENT